MKFLFDLLPILLFFGSFKWAEGHANTAQNLVNQYLSDFISGGVVTLDQAPIILATAIAIVAAVLQIGALLISRKKVDAMLWISFIIIALFGGATIYFHSETFIKWKPSIIYWCYAAAFLIGQFVFKKNLLKSVMEKQLHLPDVIWFNLSLTWVGYFILMGLANLYVAFTFTTSTWVSYKLYSSGSIIVFVILQSLFLSKYITTPNDEAV
jgi:intracellular septation protein